MGCFLISFCLGNTALPFGDRLTRDVQLIGQFLLTPACLAAEQGNFFC